jgi:hypothetical protein
MKLYHIGHFIGKWTFLTLNNFEKRQNIELILKPILFLIFKEFENCLMI